MEKLIVLKETENTPEIILDKENGVFHISGRSLIIDALQFYSPIINWFKEYFKNPNASTKLSLNLDYINSSSNLQLIKIINQFDLNNNKDNELTIEWMYKKGDERAMENGEELQYLTDVKIILKESVSEDYESFNFEF